MSAGTPTPHRSPAVRLGLIVLSVLSLLGAIRLAVDLEEPLGLLVALAGFAAYVVLFGRAVDGPALHSLDREGASPPLDFGPRRT